MAQRNLVFDIQTQDGQTLAALDRVRRKLGQTGDDAETTTKRTKTAGEQLSGYLKTVAVAAAGREVLSETNQAQTTAARTAAVIKSTGNAAEVSAAQQDSYVQALSKTAAIDDEVIAGGANLLRTFEGIKGAQFGETLGVSLDYAAAKGLDLDSAIQAIGKDVNDPVRGIQLLRRAGIQLTEQQTDQIKAFTEAGATSKAQEIIITALQERFGGSAKAMATDSARVSVAVKNTAENAGKALLPAVKVVAGVAEGFASLPGPVQSGVLGLAAAAVAANKLKASLGEGGLKGALTADVSEFGTLNTVLGASAVGLASYTTTLNLLRDTVKFKGDVQGLAKDIGDLGDGSIDANDATKELGGSVESLADTVKRANANSLKDLIQDPTNISNTQRAINSLKELDQTLAALATSDPGKAATAVESLTQALAPLGVSTEDLIKNLPRYSDALARATREGKKSADTADEQTIANQKLAGELRKVGDAAADQAQKTFDAQQALADSTDTVVSSKADLEKAQKAAQGDSDAYRSAVQAESDDLAQLADDESAVTDAKQKATEAQDNLNDARKEAKDRLDALRQAVTDTADAERDAVTAVKRAEQELERKKADPRASALDQEEAQNAVIDAQHKATEAAKDHTKAVADSSSATIEGDQGVVDAKKKVADADDAIRQAEKKVKDQRATVAADGVAKSKLIEQAVLDVKAAQDKVNDALFDQAQRYRDVAVATLGPVAGLQAYNTELKKLYDALDPNSGLAERVAALLAGVKTAISLDLGLIPDSVARGGAPAPGTPGSAIPPTRTTDRSARSIVKDAKTESGSGSITLNQTNILQGTSKQQQRMHEQSTRKVLNDHARRTR